MSKKTYTQKVSQVRWLKVLSESKHYFADPWSVGILKKLKKVRFTKEGEIFVDRYGKLALQKFSSLVRMWKERNK